MKYKDLDNAHLPVEDRLAHLEREAAHVRDFARQVTAIMWVASCILFIATIAVVTVALLH